MPQEIERRAVKQGSAFRCCKRKSCDNPYTKYVITFEVFLSRLKSPNLARNWIIHEGEVFCCQADSG
jgi:hypothetical protein